MGFNSGLKGLKCMASQKGRRTAGKPRIRWTDQERYIGKYLEAYGDA